MSSSEQIMLGETTKKKNVKRVKKLVLAIIIISILVALGLIAYHVLSIWVQSTFGGGITIDF